MIKREFDKKLREQHFKETVEGVVVEKKVIVGNNFFILKGVTG